MGAEKLEALFQERIDANVPLLIFSDENVYDEILFWNTFQKSNVLQMSMIFSLQIELLDNPAVNR